jgi:large subunit ribosomal protein L19
MDSAITQNHHQLKKNVPDLKAGDRIRVHQKIQEGSKSRIQVFEGLVIKTQHGRGINGTFTVRRISLGVGVEKCFPLHLPTIVKIEKLRSAKVRRAKLYYVRDLIGKRAQRLKKEKEDAGVWEDVIAVEDKDALQESGVENEEQGTENEGAEDKKEQTEEAKKVTAETEDKEVKENKADTQAEAKTEEKKDK